MGNRVTLWQGHRAGCSRHGAQFAGRSDASLFSMAPASVASAPMVIAA